MIDRACNLLHLCSTCHLRMVEMWRAKSYKNGWLVHQWQEPSDVPVILRGQWWLLDDAGGKTLAITDPTAPNAP